VSATLREAVVWGTQASDRMDLISSGNSVRVLAGSRVQATLNTAAIDRFVAFGLGGNDRISAIGFNKPVELDGGAGHDVLLGGNAGDILRGGAGNDFLYGFDGHDFLLGEAGRDYLFGGNGNDTLDGGTGSDYLFGQARDDWLIGGLDLDWMFDFEGSNRRQD
jgi:Ca2+-binding RTX toxin-like protein